MDAAMQEERQALGRIAALLVALAVLAERVAEKPVALRCFVIWLLSRAEIAAQGFVDGMFWRRDPTALPLQAAEKGVAEALRLASSPASAGSDAGPRCWADTISGLPWSDPDCWIGGHDDPLRQASYDCNALRRPGGPFPGKQGELSSSWPEPWTR